MFREGSILFPTDFSPFSHYGMVYAVAIAKKLSATVHIAHVLDSAFFASGGGHGLWTTKSDVNALVESMREHAESRLAHLVQLAEDDGVDAQCHIVTGRPWAETIRLAEEHHCDLIVLPTHGRTGFDRLVYGSTCEKIVRRSPVPVLSVKHPEHEFVSELDRTIRLKRVLLPTDFSEFSHRVFPYAAAVCRAFGATLVLFCVAEPAYVVPEFMPETVTTLETGLEDRARDVLADLQTQFEDIHIELEFRTGLAHREVRRAVDETGIDLIVMPTHGRTGIAHILFGSVAEKVVRLARCPVLTVHPNVLSQVLSH